MNTSYTFGLGMIQDTFPPVHQGIAMKPSSLTFLLALFVLGGALGCQKIETPTPVLTQQQWKKAQKHILKQAPTPQHKVGAMFGDRIELIGFDLKGPLVAGKPTTVTWYWRALKDIDKNWNVFGHLDSQANKRTRHSLDHVPVDSLLVTSRWKKGMIIRDIQETMIPTTYPTGKAILHVGLWRGNERMPLSNKVAADKDNRAVAGQFEITGGTTPAPIVLPKHAVRDLTDKAQSLKIDGKLDEAFWGAVPAISLAPLGKAPKLSSTVKVFYTKDHVVFGATLKDGHIWGTHTERDSRTWKQEVLEVFIDPDGDEKDYVELQITPANVIFDANFKQRLGKGKGKIQEQIDRAKAFNTPGLEHAVFVEGTLQTDKNAPLDNDTSWSVEVRIPFTSIPGMTGAPKNGSTWRMNLYRFDRPTPNVENAYAWSPHTRGSFHDVPRFGTIQFVGTSSGTAPSPSLTLTPQGVPLKIGTKQPKMIKLSPEVQKRLKRQLDQKRAQPTPK